MSFKMTNLNPAAPVKSMLSSHSPSAGTLIFVGIVSVPSVTSNLSSGSVVLGTF